MTEPQRGHLAMLAFSALVAGSFSLGGLAAPHIDPLVLNGVRFVVASVVLWTAAFVTGGITRKALAAPWRYAILAALFAFYFVTMFEGLKTASPVSMAAMFTLNPALTAVAGWVLLRQITTARMALAIAIGGAGAMWVIFRADLSALLAFEIGRGEAIFFWGCLGHSLYVPLLRRFSRGEPALMFNACVVTLGAVFLLVLGMPAMLATDFAALPVIVWITIVYTAVFATSLSFLALRYAALRLPGAKVMAYTYLTPSWVILWELALGKPLPPTLVVAGVGLTILALVLLLKDEEPRTAGA